MLNFLDKLISYVLILLRLGISILILLTILGLIAPYFSNIHSYHYLISLLNFEKSINHTVKAYIPTTIAGKDASRILTIIALIILSDILSTLGKWLTFIIQKRLMKLEFQNFQETHRLSKEKMAILENKMEQVNLSKAK